MQLYNGDSVRFIDEVGGGIIVSFKSSYIAVVKDEDGFEKEIHVNKLVKESEDLSSSLKNTRVVNQDNKTVDFPAKKQQLEKTPFELEVDLHIENLVSSHRNLTNFEIVTIQLNFFRNKLEKAIQNRKTKRLIAIHGVGTGVLKSEIRNMLDEYSTVSYTDASYRKYGFGATEVIIH